MSAPCTAKVLLLAAFDDDAPHEKLDGSISCSLALGHEGNHRATATVADAAADAPTRWWSWASNAMAEPATCGDRQLIDSRSPGSYYECRLPAGHALWHFSGLVSWPRREGPTRSEASRVLGELLATSPQLVAGLQAIAAAGSVDDVLQAFTEHLPTREATS